MARLSVLTIVILLMSFKELIVGDIQTGNSLVKNFNSGPSHLNQNNNPNHFEKKLKMELRHILMGLPKKNESGTKRSKFKRIFVPKAISDFYKYSLQKSTNVPITNNFKESDFIVTFRLQKAYYDINRTIRLLFKISKIEPFRKLIGAELRLYQYAEKIPSNYGKPYTLRIDRIYRNRKGLEEFSHEYSYKGKLSSNGNWVILNVTAALQSWLDNPLRNYGLRLSIDFGRHIPANKWSRDTKVNIVDQFKLQPSIIGYFKNTGHKSYGIEKTIKAALEHEYESRAKRSPFDKEKFRNQRCRKHDLYINFTTLGLEDIIIEPRGYNAHFCYGHCQFPFSSNTETTPHSIIQSYVNLLHPEIPPPCCVPTKLKNMYVISVRDDVGVVLENKRDMVVESCGCL